MCSQHSIKIDISDEFTVDDEGRSGFKEAARVIERTTRSGLRFIDVLKFDSKLTAIAQRRRTESGR